MAPVNRVRYIQSATSLADNWKVQELSAALEIPYVQALGHLHLLWWFSANATPESQESGELSRFSTETLERRMQWAGVPGALLASLVLHKWLDEENGVVSVHDWCDHSGAGVDRMNVKATKAREARGRMRQPTTATTDESVPLQTGLTGSTAAVRILREVLGIGNPDEDARRAIANAVPEPTDDNLAELRRCAEAWKLRGYSRKNIAGVLEWYVGGIPQPRAATGLDGNRPTAASNMRAIGDALTREATDGNSGATGRRSRFNQLLAGNLPTEGSARRGSGGPITGLLGGGGAPILVNA